MLAVAAIETWHWLVFVAAILVFLALDLGVFHRQAHVVKFKEALGWTTVWFILAIAFALFLAPALVPSWGAAEKDEFITGYIVELSLSMDNVFVMALIFSYFRVPLEHQHRVLFWGILGALVMRGLMIWLGAELIEHFKWSIVLFGAFLIFTGIKMFFAKEEGVHPEQNPFIRLAHVFFPVTKQFEGQKFFTRLDGRRALTPLALVLVMVETTDLVFALDSIPAIFAITNKPFIVFTSNVFAILGLRSLYFVLAGAIGYFRYLKFGLSIVLIFIGGKMLAGFWGHHIPTRLSLWIVAGIIVLSILLSVLAARFGKKSSG
ncbi:MAG: TerC family protein [Verrucomicrobia bacterium]|nr:TerC family protein [Verrucomicrobiota bacterium]